ncbi:acetyltransferase-like isoleucine patch superfamily enzyme [Salsuginibacillus halophilus]|uniref:Acetyltransferase-like isoleucine patch superfamily enzyme n=1 Tax=Salsuginibacillus halophilus TaxID=517424 RepID=A0A2P8H951_9BACI|nr:acyltransferase [Salsuginibacillus halophilus]PSL42757.1 acetyltransferase-like isoleucine patch superfamily enzyme [Salsuginibacillus halophilus]
MRRTTRYPVEGANSLWHVYRTVPFWKVAKNFVVIQMARYTPFLPMKNWLYRTFLRMEVGKESAFALMVMLDVMFPEKISVGRNSIIGYNTTILAHEYLIEEYRLGDVEIGSRVMIGANTTILPGVKIGDGAVVAAGTLVHRDVAPGAFVGGNPMTVIKPGESTDD